MISTLKIASLSTLYEKLELVANLLAYSRGLFFYSICWFHL